MKAIKTLMAAAMTATLNLAGGCAGKKEIYEKVWGLLGGGWSL